MTKNSQSFSLSLKISGEMVKLLIHVYQTKDQTFERLANLYPHCHHKKQEILNRIIQTLNYQLDEGKLNQKLKGSIQMYLHQNDAFMTYRKHSPLIVHKNISHNKIIKSQSKQSTTPLKNRDNNALVVQCQAKNAKSFNKIEVQKCSIGNNNREKKMSIVTPVRKLNINLKSLPHQKKINPDVIKACEVILKKTTNSDMKMMAKQFLKQKGMLKDDKNNYITAKKKLQILSSCTNQEEAKDQMPLNGQSSASINSNTKNSFTPDKIYPQFNNNLHKCNKANRYKYLEPSLTQSLNKDYSLVSITQKSMQKSKKYNYLDDS